MLKISRVVLEADWAEVKPLFRALQEFEKSLRPQRQETAEIVAGAFQYIRDNIAAHDGACLVAHDDKGAATGFIAGWAADSDGLDRGQHRVGYVSDCYILPNSRNGFTFKKLLAAIEAHFIAVGLDRISFDALAANGRMLDLVKHFGYAPHKIIFEKPLDST